jgi:uncharacterized peroxidase-related enzyme
MFIDTIPKSEAEGLVREIYDDDEAAWGYLPNFTQLFSHRPEAYQAWLTLIKTIRGPMDRRRCELATVAAARTMKSTACMVAHSKMLRDRFFSTDEVVRIAVDHHEAGLDEVDVAIMDFAEKVASEPTDVTQADIDHLESLGLTERDVLDVVLSVAARAFFTTVIDSLGMSPEQELLEQVEADLLEVLVVGRPLPTT